MRGIQLERFGGPDVLRAVDLPEPVAGPGQVVIGVAYADVLFLETQVRRGEAFFTPPLPYVPGGAVGGRITAVGQDVEPAWLGRQVVAKTVPPAGAGAGGGYAQRALARVETVSTLPNGVSLRDATALTHDGPTAVRLFDNAVSEGALRPGAWVLVPAAAGGLGSLLVQLARAAGARVVAAARGERKLALAREELGAHAAVDYTKAGWTEKVRAVVGERGVDVVFDGAGGTLGGEAFELTARGALFSAHGAPGGGFAQLPREAAAARGVALAGIEQVQLSAGQAKPLLDRALFETAGGRLAPVVGQTFPLADAAGAHAAIEARATLGKTLLTVE
ncbi:zinc-binding dehydrogenase [Streptomyces tubbatahanensis]|uniref:Zinc-binding dehydrogenase n=1 Tax=Streptomyces tubbatahanensis TaxID=2923272 RepID=A0ABY3XVA3_9ACTN|nr:zinc-binding dehydrogenase [Streptomyces tubbatahanensis]UNS98327.1 zinc-binding dehydrogenase [Streptomyces tubbatahanensis]